MAKVTGEVESGDYVIHVPQITGQKIWSCLDEREKAVQKIVVTLNRQISKS